MVNSSLEQEKIILRTKLDDLAAATKKLTSVIKMSQSEMSWILVEPQILSRLAGIAVRIGILKSLEESEGDIFASFLKSITNLIHSMGNFTRLNRVEYREQKVMVLKALKNLEIQIGEFMPVITTIDEERKKADFETFGGLLQKLVDAVQEKRFMIMSASDEDENKAI